jgi:DNA-binding beta-propeller fold protein YncE
VNALQIRVGNSAIPPQPGVFGCLTSEYIFFEEFAPNEQFSNPDITIDRQTGNIFVTDYFNNRVVKFDATGSQRD